MGKKTINQALKDLFLGLGGDSSALADNSSVSDYIEDLESAIKGAASGAEIDDTTASESTVYSSSKVESIIPEGLPTVEAADIGDVLTVVSDGESGAEWGKRVLPTPEQNTVIFKVQLGTGTATLKNASIDDIKTAVTNGKAMIILSDDGNYQFAYCGRNGQKHNFVCMISNTGTPTTQITFHVLQIANNEPSGATTMSYSTLTLPTT